MPNSPRTEVFLRIKQTLRNHPEWTDDQVADQAGVKLPERDLITTARRDLEAG